VQHKFSDDDDDDDVKGLNEDTPHWMASLHHLTEDNGTSGGGSGNTFGLSNPLQLGSSWTPSQMMSARVLPPGFGLSAASSRPNQTADGQLLGERQLSA